MDYSQSGVNQYNDHCTGESESLYGDGSMKKTAIAGVAALTLLDISASTPAQAQGVTNSYAGGYIGGHVGSMSGDATFKSAPYNFVTPADTFALPGRSDAFDFNTFIAGVHGGYNFVTPSNILLGIEGDWTNIDDKDSVSLTGAGDGILNGDGFVFEQRSTLELDWQATIRGRVGLISGNWLFFGTAGIAFLSADWRETGTLSNTTVINQNFSSSHRDSDTLTGFVVGGGIANAITPNIIVRLDGLYETFEDFKNVPHGFTTPAQRGKIEDIDIYKIRFGVSFRLGTVSP